MVTVLIIFFVPKFEDLFERLRGARRIARHHRRCCWRISHTVGKWGWLVVIVLVERSRSCTPAINLPTEAGRGLERSDETASCRWLASIFQNLAVARFCRVLGTLLHNGVPILRSLEISSSAAGNRILAAAITEARRRTFRPGNRWPSRWRVSGYFPGEVVEMIAVAEESNTLETVLTNIADSLERRTFRRLDLMVRLLEPLDAVAVGRRGAGGRDRLADAGDEDEHDRLRTRRLRNYEPPGLPRRKQLNYLFGCGAIVSVAPESRIIVGLDQILGRK